LDDSESLHEKWVESTISIHLSPLFGSPGRESNLNPP